ncbi:heterokaryon incompatibility protein-domain-containing protein, partial [Dactylonectria macrodidyma]
MRLINTCTLQLAGPFFSADVPPYAILSHTWSSEELCLQDMANVSQHNHKSGYHKIKRFCERALSDGYIYGWVDTVCIDKTSSAELSEAINSMFKWYKNSSVCYAALEDLHTNKESTTLSDLEKCRWFTRGWTLQELIAPEKLIFFNTNWVEVGSKTELEFCGMIEDITTVDYGTLLGFSPRLISISRRMSWASRRQTSRIEDLAYSLLGLFGINMPLLYGEGDKAFLRLQEEILRTSDDHTIFAWSTDNATSRGGVGHWGLLAPSAACFRNADYVPVRGLGYADHALTSRGIYLKAWTNKSCTQMALNCRPRSMLGMICTIPILRLRTGPNDFSRSYDPPEPSWVPSDKIEEISRQTEVYVRTNIHDDEFEEEHLVDYLEVTTLPNPVSGYKLEEWFPGSRLDSSHGVIRASPFPYINCGAILVFENASPDLPRLMVALFADGLPEGSDSIARDFAWVFQSDK